MSGASKISEILGQNSDSTKLFRDLETMDTDRDLVDYVEQGSGENIIAKDALPVESGVQEQLSSTRSRVITTMTIVTIPGNKRDRSFDTVHRVDESSVMSHLNDEIEKRYDEFIDRLCFPMEQKEKLSQVLAVYDDAVAAAREMDPHVRVPSKEQVVDRLLSFDIKKLEKVATIFGKPGLIIVPDISFVEMKNVMNDSRHYDVQKEAYFAGDYEWSGRPGKVSVSIVDMVQYPAVVPGQKPGDQSNYAQLRICEEYFRNNGMSLIADRQYAVALQQSLRAYEKAKWYGEVQPERHILDFYGRPKETVTMFHQENEFAIMRIADGDFDPQSRRGHFSWSYPSANHYYLRGRGAVCVL